MDLGNLQYADGARKNRKRVGRGGAHGKQSCKGHKGARSRSGYKSRAWFEGGQMPIQRRLPKRGFTNIFRVEYQLVNLSQLEKLEGVEEVTPLLLFEKRVVDKKSLPVKVLGMGQLTKKLSVSANAFSKTASDKIAAAGGRAIVL